MLDQVFQDFQAPFSFARLNIENFGCRPILRLMRRKVPEVPYSI
jgi:hypothetical protein